MARVMRLPAFRSCTSLLSGASPRSRFRGVVGAIHPTRSFSGAENKVGSVTPFGHEGKLVIVTGGANGLGRSISVEFARCGANVICADIDDEGGSAAVQEAADLPGTIKYVRADFSDAAVPQQLIKDAMKWQGGAPVAVLVNNVGIQKDNGIPAHLLSEELWDLVMNVNLKSYFLMAKHALPSMLAAGEGVIINMASVQGHQSQVGIPAYASSKGGILSLTRQLAMVRWAVHDSDLVYNSPACSERALFCAGLFERSHPCRFRFTRHYPDTARR